MSEDRTPSGLRRVKPDEAPAYGNTEGVCGHQGKRRSVAWRMSFGDSCLELIRIVEVN